MVESDRRGGSAAKQDFPPDLQRLPDKRDFILATAVGFLVEPPPVPLAYVRVQHSRTPSPADAINPREGPQVDLGRHEGPRARPR